MGNLPSPASERGAQTVCGTADSWINSHEPPADSSLPPVWRQIFFWKRWWDQQRDGGGALSLYYPAPFHPSQQGPLNHCLVRELSCDLPRWEYPREQPPMSNTDDWTKAAAPKGNKGAGPARGHALLTSCHSAQIAARTVGERGGQGRSEGPALKVGSTEGEREAVAHLREERN